MLKLLTPRLLSVYAIALFLTACASNQPYSSGNPSPSRTDSTHSQSRSHSSDIWQRIRDGYQMPDLYNEEVTSKEKYYAQRADYVGRMANRSGDFMYIIMNEVERRNMPTEIALLPFVESAFVTTAQSPVKAAGLWQFMPATGRDFSLQQNHFADQRNDVVASTDAALTFLQRLHNQFGDWQLALAAYNWGPGNVTKAVRRAQANGLAGTYSDIKMPTETRQYVPKLQAIKNIVSNPEQFGISLPNISNNKRHEVVTVTRDIDISTAAQLAGMDINSFKSINPAYKKTVIAASLGSKILVPANRADDLRAAFRDKSQTLSSLTTYSTYNTEALDDIASKFNTHADNLRYLNNIPASHGYVKAGSALLVPRTSNKASQDIPYEALTAGLSTTSGGIGLSNGDYIEQPTLVVNNTDETTRQERSGVISSFPTSGKNNGPGLVVSNDDNDEDGIGLLIKNRSKDPVKGENALVVNSPNANTLAAPPALPLPIPPVTIAAPTPKPTPVLSATSVVSMHETATPIVETVAAPIPALPTTPTATPPVQVVQSDPVLAPIVAIEDKPEVIEPLMAKAKPVVLKTREAAPAAAQYKAAKVSAKSAPKLLPPTEKDTKQSKKAEQAKPVVVKASAKTSAKPKAPEKAKVAEKAKPAEKARPVEKSKTAVKPKAPEAVAPKGKATKAVEKTAAKTSTTKPIEKPVAAAKAASKKPSKK